MLDDFEKFTYDEKKIHFIENPPTPFMIFINENRQDYRKKYPNMPLIYLYKMMSDEFPPKKEKKYIKIHKQYLKKFKKHINKEFRFVPEAIVEKPKTRVNSSKSTAAQVDSLNRTKNPLDTRRA